MDQFTFTATIDPGSTTFFLFKPLVCEGTSAVSNCAVVLQVAGFGHSIRCASLIFSGCKRTGAKICFRRIPEKISIAFDDRWIPVRIRRLSGIPMIQAAKACQIEAKAARVREAIETFKAEKTATQN